MYKTQAKGYGQCMEKTKVSSYGYDPRGWSSRFSEYSDGPSLPPSYPQNIDGSVQVAMQSVYEIVRCLVKHPNPIGYR